jgi:hypothetical protein
VSCQDAHALEALEQWEELEQHMGSCVRCRVDLAEAEASAEHFEALGKGGEHASDAELARLAGQAVADWTLEDHAILAHAIGCAECSNVLRLARRALMEDAAGELARSADFRDAGEPRLSMVEGVDNTFIVRRMNELLAADACAVPEAFAMRVRREMVWWAKERLPLVRSGRVELDFESPSTLRLSLQAEPGSELAQLLNRYVVAVKLGDVRVSAPTSLPHLGRVVAIIEADDFIAQRLDLAPEPWALHFELVRE